MKQKGNILMLAILVLSVALTAALTLFFFFPGRESEPVEPIPLNQYSPADFYYNGGYLSCLTTDTVLGIDVSRHQGQIDWQQVKAAGVEFVMVRLGNRGTSEGTLRVDPMFWQNLLGARAVGLKVGAYFFSQAVSVEEAQEEAAFALGILDGIRLDMPLAFDWEQETRTENVDAQMLTDCTRVFCEAVKTAGYDPLIYFNSFQAKNLLRLEELKDIPWWLAMYDVTMEFPYRMDMWQYSNTGTVPGIKGDVDLNLLFVDGLI